MTSFMCSVCGQVKKNKEPHTTGYAVDQDKNIICYDCCGKLDSDKLVELKPGETFMMYWQEKTEEVTNWPGSLAIHVSHHTMTKHYVPGTGTVKRYNFWFNHRGNQYWGYQIGYNNQVAYVKRAFGRKKKTKATIAES